MDPLCTLIENPSGQGGNQQHTRPTYGTGPELNLSHIDVRRVLSPMLHPCFPHMRTRPLVHGGLEQEK